jgi:hypothetical protein
MNYSEEIKIDKHRLDEHLVEQSELYISWSDLYAEAIAESERQKEVIANLKDELARTRAVIDLEVRESPEIFGLKKTTDKAIESCILLDKRYIEQQNKMHEAKLEYIEKKEIENKLKGSEEAFRQRRKNIENLVTLMIGGYYSEPRIDCDPMKRGK